MTQVLCISKGQNYSDKLLLYFTQLLDQSVVVFRKVILLVIDMKRILYSNLRFF